MIFHICGQLCTRTPAYMQSDRQSQVTNNAPNHLFQVDWRRHLMDSCTNHPPRRSTEEDRRTRRAHHVALPESYQRVFACKFPLVELRIARETWWGVTSGRDRKRRLARRLGAALDPRALNGDSEPCICQLQTTLKRKKKPFIWNNMLICLQPYVCT